MVSRMQALNFSSSRAPGTYGNNMPPPRHPFGMFGRGPMQQNPYPYGMGGFTPSPQPQQPQQTGFGAGWGRNHFGAQQGSPRPAPHQYGQHPPQPYMSNMFMGGFNGARPSATSHGSSDAHDIRTDVLAPSSNAHSRCSAVTFSVCVCILLSPIAHMALHRRS